jgi:hypothetical protein
MFLSIWVSCGEHGPEPLLYSRPPYLVKTFPRRPRGIDWITPTWGAIYRCDTDCCPREPSRVCLSCGQTLSEQSPLLEGTETLTSPSRTASETRALWQERRWCGWDCVPRWGRVELNRRLQEKCGPERLSGGHYHIHSRPSEMPCEKMLPLLLTTLTGLAANWSCSGARATPEIHMKS